ncbi:MAG: hypothetical protein IKX71_06775 [Bacteroidales bacterium]|nr:hypothetical protein [Bacteroidales bacterium]
MDGNEADVFYRERYGIDITDYGYVVQKSLESLYQRGVRLSVKKLYRKFEQSGISLKMSSLERIRLRALLRRTQDEPPMLTDYGARMWYIMQMRPFEAHDMAFLAGRFPMETARHYPHLICDDGYLIPANMYSNSTASAKKAAVIRHSLSAAPHTR